MKPALPPLPTLGEEALAALPALIEAAPDGVTVPRLCDRLGIDPPAARRAMREVNTSCRARLMRRKDSREFYLVPNSYRAAPGFDICVICEAPFVLQHKSKRRTCSKSCHIALTWRNPQGRARRVASIKQERRTPKALARTAKLNRERWARPGERERLVEQNRREWGDPAKKANRARAIKQVNGSPEKRAKTSKIKKRQWRDPQYRMTTVEGIRRSKRSPEARAQFSELLKARWRDPVMRKKYLRATRENRKRALDAVRGKKQSPEQVRKRIEKTRLTKQAATPRSCTDGPPSVMANRREPPDGGCACSACVEACRNVPGRMTPAEARRAIEAGFASRLMMMSYRSDRIIEDVLLLSPAARGQEGKFPPSCFDELGRCTFLTRKNRCQIHESGFKPLECRNAFGCDRKRSAATIEEMESRYVRPWRARAGRAVVVDWKRAVGLP